MPNCRLELKVSVKHWVTVNSLHYLENQKAAIFELELVYRPEVCKCYYRILLSKVRRSGVLFIFVFGLLDSIFMNGIKQSLKPKTLRNYLPVNKKVCLTLMKPPQFSELLGTLYFKTAVRASDLPVGG